MFSNENIVEACSFGFGLDLVSGLIKELFWRNKMRKKKENSSNLKYVKRIAKLKNSQRVSERSKAKALNGCQRSFSWGSR